MACDLICFVYVLQQNKKFTALSYVYLLRSKSKVLHEAYS